MSDFDKYDIENFEEVTRERVAEGEYNLEIIDASMDEKDELVLVKVKYGIIGGKFEGQWLFDNFAILCLANKDRQNIGKAMFKRLRESVGLSEVKNVSELIGKKLRAELVWNGKFNNLKNYNAFNINSYLDEKNAEVSSGFEDMPDKEDDSDDIPF